MVINMTYISRISDIRGSTKSDTRLVFWPTRFSPIMNPILNYQLDDGVTAMLRYHPSQVQVCISPSSLASSYPGNHDNLPQ